MGDRGWQRKSNNFVDNTELTNQRRVVGGWEPGVTHKEFIGNATLEGNLAYKRGTGAFGSQPAPEESFGGGTSRFALITADANLSWPFKIADQKLRYTGTWRWQLNRTPLTPQDRFAIGGRYSVRGFDGESSLSAERGWLFRNEISAALGGSDQEIYLGLDHDEVSGPSSEFLVGTRRLAQDRDHLLFRKSTFLMDSSFRRSPHFRNQCLGETGQVMRSPSAVITAS